MPVTELTFAPDCAPSDIPTSVNLAPPPRYFRVDSPSGKQALFGQSLINPYFYFYSYYHILPPFYFLPGFFCDSLLARLFQPLLSIPNILKVHTAHCNDGLQRWQFSVTSIKWSVGLLSTKSHMKNLWALGRPICRTSFL